MRVGARHAARHVVRGIRWSHRISANPPRPRQGISRISASDMAHSWPSVMGGGIACFPSPVISRDRCRRANSRLLYHARTELRTRIGRDECPTGKFLFNRLQTLMGGCPLVKGEIERRSPLDVVKRLSGSALSARRSQVSTSRACHRAIPRSAGSGTARPPGDGPAFRLSSASVTRGRVRPGALAVDAPRRMRQPCRDFHPRRSSHAGREVG